VGPWLALALALSVIVSWGARRHAALQPHQDEPRVALAPEPAPVHQATRAVELGDDIEQPGVEQPSAEQRPALPAAPSPPPLPALSEPPRRAQGQVGASSSREPSGGLRLLHLGVAPMERGSDPFYPGAPPASILWLDEAGAAHIESSGDKRQVAGFWTVESWDELPSLRRPALRQMPDRRQCVDVPRNDRLVLGWRSRGGPGRRGFELVQGQRYRLMLPRVSVTGPVQLELIVIVGSSDGSQGPALVTHVMSTPTPSTVGFIFEPRHNDDRAPVSLFIDAVGPSGASKLCLAAARLESLPEQAEADAGAEPASAVAAAAEKNAQLAAQGRREPAKLPADKAAGMKEDGKKKAAPAGSTEKPPDKPAEPRKANCKQPFYIDAKGVRRLKLKCL
jgi:hypothetical protein